MLPARIAGSWATLPSSQSFIKIVDIPYFKPGTTEPPNGQEIGDQLIPSPILVNMIKHMQFIHNSPKANSGAKAHTSSPSVNNAGNGATHLTHADAQLQPQGLPPPFSPPLQTWLAPMFTLVSTAALNTLWMTGAAPIGATTSIDAAARKAPTSVPMGLPLPFPPPLPSTLPCPASHWPHSNAGHTNSAPATIWPPPLPPISFPSLSSVVEDDIMNFSFNEDEAHKAAGPQPGNYAVLLIAHRL
ncbi:hypothetical protein P691DRAFT_768280 [Macrolepiota fuliginosa MF-IS2]|uniref:Uncharacterized protein n=1 Tax=Macrolepiota fuliginosa MF-IS2 TaxID=1400762 RepID=A0A9P6BW12_9AGAR|nr:hypothetical protein P691DRAFT_768280 [Macrolepiota fuliginosa MF-IS2]